MKLSKLRIPLLFQSNLPVWISIISLVSFYNSLANELCLNNISSSVTFIQILDHVARSLAKCKICLLIPRAIFLLAFLFPGRLHFSWEDPSCSLDWSIHSTAGASFLWNAAGIDISKAHIVIQMLPFPQTRGRNPAKYPEAQAVRM